MGTRQHSAFSPDQKFGLLSSLSKAGLMRVAVLLAELVGTQCLGFRLIMPECTQRARPTKVRTH